MRNLSNNIVYFIILSTSLVLTATQIRSQEVELITTFEGEEEMGVSIKLSELSEFDEKITQSPPSLKLIFQNTKFTQKLYSKQISIPPLCRVNAVEKRDGKPSTEVILYFTSLPKYYIETEGGNIVRVAWIPKKEEIRRRVKSRRISMLEATVSLHFKEAELINILRLLAVQNNLNIIAGEEVEGKVTVSLSDVNLGTALDAILKVNGYDWFIQDNIVVVKPEDKKMTGELITRIYKLEYVDASAVSTAISNVLTPKGKVQIFSPVMKMGMGGVGAGVVQAGAGLLGTSGGGTMGAAPSGAGLPGTMGGAAGAAGSGGMPSPDHLLVTDAHYNFDRIEKVIYDLDKQIPQINIAVKFIETKLNMDERLGINWDLRASLTGPKVLEGVSELPIGGGLKLGENVLRIATLSVPVFSSIIEILSTDSDTRLIQEPQVTTFDNTMASVRVGTTYPVLVPQPEGDLIGTRPYEFQDEEINISLSVQPRINEDKYISMTINAMVQALVGFTGPNADRPVISDRSTSTQVMVADGETLLIGGLLFDQVSETETSLPLLGSIPLLGKLFTHKSTTMEQRELLIFITPNIVKMF
ncbi:hypothetical protein KJ762_10490 [bacterium]|nr:hypothetical protein [bacterium]MBU1064887.1 hypothetical protein [bacterium]MBU1634922.1 hypothetical protein [bacterium]MBU1872603.1 hypothetical protein [bacterium]